MTLATLHELRGAAGQCFSPYVWRVKMVLAHLGLAHARQGHGFTDISQVAGGNFKTLPVYQEASGATGDSWDIVAKLAADTGQDIYGGTAGRAWALYLNAWSSLAITGPILCLHAVNIWEDLRPEDQDYFRTTREKRMGASLEALRENPEAQLTKIKRSLAPFEPILQSQDFLGGAQPIYADYLMFGNLQFARCTGPHEVLKSSPATAAWFERCLDLHAGLGRSEASYHERHAV